MAITFRKFAIGWLIVGTIFTILMFFDALAEGGFDPIASVIGWSTIATIPIAISKYQDSRRKQVGKIQ